MPKFESLRDLLHDIVANLTVREQKLQEDMHTVVEDIFADDDEVTTPEGVTDPARDADDAVVTADADAVNAPPVPGNDGDLTNVPPIGATDDTAPDTQPADAPADGAE